MSSSNVSLNQDTDSYPQRPSATNATAPKLSGSVSGRNPISLRLYKVLSTNFDDESTKEALWTLSDLYQSASSTSNHDPQTIPNVIEDGEDLKDVKEKYSLSSAPKESFSGESAVRARKNLRRDMEVKLAAGSRQFLDALGNVDKKLSELQAHVTAIRLSCDDAERQLSLTNEASRDVLERAGNLRDERQAVDGKKSIISLFLDRFKLTGDETEALTSRDVSIGTAFFAALDKTEQIREDCRVLMSGEDGPTQAGSDIMSFTSSSLEQGYDKVLRWCCNEFRQMRDLQPEVSNILRDSIVRLRKRSELLSEALSILAQTRQSALLSAFITALTRGGSSGLPRPIELHAHDPLRYVGDMLAWVHQAIAAEHEFLESLFGVKGNQRMMGSVRKFSAEDTIEDDWVSEIMNSGVGGLCGPLKMRVQQTIKSQESSIISYKVANLLQFYLVTMQRTIGTQANLSLTLQEITDAAYKVFYDAIESQSRTLSRILLDIEDDSLLPPIAVLDHLQILRDLMTVYQSSLMGDEDEKTRDAGFHKVLDIMVDPVVEMCDTAALQKKRQRPAWDEKIWVINCLSYLTSVLDAFEFTSQKQKNIQHSIDERVQSLIEEHFTNIMTDTGLRDVVHICKNRLTSEPLSHIPNARPTELRAALHKFSGWLSGLEVVHSTRLSQLTAQKLHTEVHQTVLMQVVKAYELLCDEVKKPENKYEAASTLLGTERPFGQVHLLWQIFGLEDEEGHLEG
ncbi:oligomeric Golgi complex subunit 6 [Cyathus striatus]|nr:oligomeric Golgi complex subunit 6 [Cyathus striatus]